MSVLREPTGLGSVTGPAESVLDLRHRLWQVLRRAADEAKNSSLADEKQVALLRLAEAAREPFLLVIAGEVNSGKSTFVNAFFREEVTLSDVLPTTENVLWFRHGEASDEHWQDDVIIRRRPTAFLRDFHVVDTPGTNSIVIGHDATTERFLPMADLVVLVLPITNPWSASAWGFLERLLRQWRKRVVLVLQQADLLDSAAVATVCGHVRGRLHSIHGEVLPLFPVSGKLALQAHGAKAMEEKIGLWEKSGFSAVETYLRERVGRYESRLLKMRNTVEAGLNILRQILPDQPPVSGVDFGPPVQDGVVGSEEKLVQEIDERIDSEERFALAAIPAVVEPMVQRWRELEVMLPGQVEGRLGILATLAAILRGDRTARFLAWRIQAGMDDTAENCRTHLIASLRERGERAWESLCSHLASTYDFSLRLDTPDGRPDFADWASAATTDLPGRMAEVAAECPLESTLARRLSTRMTVLRGLFLLMAALGGAGWWAWQAALPLPSIMAAAVAMFSALLVAAGIAQQGIASITEECARSMEAHRVRIAESATIATELATREYFRRIGHVFDPVRKLHLSAPDGPGSPLGAIRRELESIGTTIDEWTRHENRVNYGLSGSQVGLD